MIWIIETAIFLIYEGWHVKATNPIEIYFDKVVSECWHFALFMTLFICGNYIINLSKNRVKKQ